jgi:hypothetical protein
MSRLYYPPTASDQLRRGNPNIDPGEAAKKIGKLIPTELVTAYGALVGASLALHWPNLRLPATVACFVICWVLTPIYLNEAADQDDKPKRRQIVIGTIAFPVWAYLVSGSQVIPQYYDAALGVLIATVFSLVSVAIPIPVR